MDQLGDGRLLCAGLWPKLESGRLKVLIINPLVMHHLDAEGDVCAVITGEHDLATVSDRHRIPGSNLETTEPQVNDHGPDCRPLTVHMNVVQHLVTDISPLVAIPVSHSREQPPLRPCVESHWFCTRLRFHHVVSCDNKSKKPSKVACWASL